MATETTPLELIGFKGLNVDGGKKSPGCMKKAVNVDILADRTIQTRKGFRSIQDDVDNYLRRVRGVHEFIKEDGTKYILADIDHNFYDSGLVAPSTKSTGSTVTLGGTVSAIESPDFNIKTKEAYVVKNNRKSAEYNNQGCSESLWPDSSLNFVVEIDSLDEGVDPITKDVLPTVKVSKDGGSAFYRTKISMIRDYDTIEKTFARIGNCDKMDFKDLVIYFHANRDFVLGEQWTFSLNLMDGLDVAEASITHVTNYNDLSSGGAFTAAEDVDYLIETDATNTFKWSKDDGATWEATGVTITGAAQTLDNGVTVTFGNTTGYLVGLSWYVYATKADYPTCSNIKIYYTYLIKDTDGNVVKESDPSPVETVAGPISEGDGLNATYTASGDSDVTHIRLYRSRILDATDIRMVKDVVNGTGNTNLDSTDDTILDNPEMETDQENADAKTRVQGAENTSTDEKITIGAWSIMEEGLDTTNNPIPCYANGFDRAYRTDGQNNNMVFKNITDPWLPCGITPPDTAPTHNTTKGNYRWYYIYVREESDRDVYSNPSPVGYSDGPNARIDVKESTEPGITGIWVYRSLEGKPTDIRKVGAVSNHSETHEFDEVDNEIRYNDALQTDNYKPYKCKYVKVAGGRMLYINVTESSEADSGGKSWVVPSKIGYYEHMTNDIKMLDAKDGQEITGASDPVQNKLLIFKKSKTFFFDATTLGHYLLYSGVGCASYKSIQNIGEGAGVIWVSMEGVIHFDGGEKHNISRTQVDGEGNVTSGGVNNIILPYIKLHSADFCDSAYYPRSRQYHLLVKDPNDITDQRYLVYHLESGQWTEYIFYDDDGNQLYVHGMCTSADYNLEEALVLFMHTSDAGDEISLYQAQYDFDPEYPDELIDSTGADSKTLDKPLSTVIDSNDNIYVQAETGHKFFKISGAEGTLDTPSFLFEDTDIETALNAALGRTPTLLAATKSPMMAIDSTYFYFVVSETYGGANKYHLMKSTFTGTVSYCIEMVSKTVDVYMHELPMHMTADGYLWFCYSYDNGIAGYDSDLVRIGDPGGTPALFSWAPFLPGIVPRAFEYDGSGTFYFIEVDTLNAFDETFSSHTTEGVYTKLLDFDLGVNFVDFDTRQLSLAYISTTELFFNHAGSLHRAYYSDSAWSISKYYDPDSGSVDKVYSFDEVLIWVDYTNNRAYAHCVDYPTQTRSRKFSVILLPTGDGTNQYNPHTHPSDNVRHRSNDEIILVGYTTDNVWKTGLPCKPFRSKYESDGVENFEGVVGDVEFYLTLDHKEKAFRLAHQITDSDYSVGLIFSVMPDDRTGYSKHSRNESAAPSGSHCSTAAVTFGVQPWVAGDFSDMGTRVKHRINLTGIGHEFYIHLKFGNLSKSSKGQIVVVPTTMLIQAFNRD